MLTAVIVLGILVLVLVVLVVRQSLVKPDTGSALLIKQDLTQLSDDITKLKDGLHSQITDRLDKNQALMLGSLQKQFGESSKLISEVTRNLTELKETNKQVFAVTDELKTLQNILQNPKQRGVIGEYYLSQVLDNVLPPNRYKLQYKFKDGEIVDAVVILDKGKMLPVDSKFSLENYNRLVEERDKDKRELIVRAFKTDLKNRRGEVSAARRGQIIRTLIAAHAWGEILAG